MANTWLLADLIADQCRVFSVFSVFSAFSAFSVVKCFLWISVSVLLGQVVVGINQTS